MVKANGGTVNWGYSVDPDAVEFLAAGQTRTLVYTLTVDDQNGGTKFGQGVSNGKTGYSKAKHNDTKVTPICVPTVQVL